MFSWKFSTVIQLARFPIYLYLLRPAQSFSIRNLAKPFSTYTFSSQDVLPERLIMSRKRSKKDASVSIEDQNTKAGPLQDILEKASVIPQTKGRWYVHEAITHLATVEPKFTELFLKYELPSVYLGSGVEAAMASHNWEDPPFTVLAQIIVYQQLSGASAGSVWKKFLSCFDVTEGKDLTPNIVQKAIVRESIDSDGKKKILINDKPSGLSASKAKYVKALTDAFLDESMLKNVNWDTISDEELYEKLIAVKGLGMWSVHMFMMFALHRPNVLPLGDLGIRRGLCNFFGYPKGHLEIKQNVKKMDEICAAWAPYSSFASFYLWRHSEEPVASKEKASGKVKKEKVVVEEQEETEDQPKKKRRTTRRSQST
jgi:DNA-3-methyladenine glycosylase II